MNLRRHKGRRQHMLTLFSSAEMCWFNSPSYLRIFGHCSTKLSREARLWPPNDGAKGSSLREDPEDRNENFLNGCFWSVQFRSWGRSSRYQHPLSAILQSLSLWLCRTLQLSLSLSLSLFSHHRNRGVVVVVVIPLSSVLRSYFPSAHLGKRFERVRVFSVSVFRCFPPTRDFRQRSLHEKVFLSTGAHGIGIQDNGYWQRKGPNHLQDRISGLVV